MPPFRRFAPLLIAVLAAALLATPAAGSSADPLQPRQWGLEQVRAPAAWSVGQGAGATIAVVDTGVDAGHEDLEGALLPGRSFVRNTPSTQDDNGHGTHVAGIAAARAGNGRGVAGVAPRARILPVKVLAGDGTGRESDVVAGIRWAADQGAHVINVSIGEFVPLRIVAGSPFNEAAAYAWSRGSIVVLSAGNGFLQQESGYRDVQAIVVTATTRQDRSAVYADGVGSAQWGMAAPGGAGTATAGEEDDVLSTFWRRGARNSYDYLAGTSMAAPHVAGAAAVLRALGLSPQATVDRLLATATDLGPRGRDATYGAGRLDVARAVADVNRPAGGASAPSASAPATTAPPTTAAARTAPSSSPAPAPSRSEPTPSPAADAAATVTPDPGAGETGPEPAPLDDDEAPEAPEAGGEALPAGRGPAPTGDTGADGLGAWVALAALALTGVGAVGARVARRR